MSQPDRIAARFRQRRDSVPDNDIISYAQTVLGSAECASCCFYYRGKCHAQAPVRDELGHAAWPEVRETDWCGYWSASY